MKYQLAQLNIARFGLPAEDTVNADSMNARKYLKRCRQET
ncbi:MAG: hypothetical protein DHS20C05_23940 [Hyphococcus sp.]|nr:MAG: hypothetical protein DHS20C05_23940 [Marinicaulis sp.]